MVYPLLCLGKGLCGDILSLQERSDCGHFSVREKKMGVRGVMDLTLEARHIVRLGLFPHLWKGRRLPRC